MARVVATVFPDNFAYHPNDVAKDVTNEGNYLFNFKDHEGYDLGLSDLFLRTQLSSVVQTIFSLVKKQVTFTKNARPGLVCLLPRIDIKATTYTLSYAYYERGISSSDVALSLEFKSYGAMAEFLNQTIFYVLYDIENFIDDDPTTRSSRELFIDNYVNCLKSHLRFGNYNQIMETLYFVPIFLFKKIDSNFLWNLLTTVLEHSVTNSGPNIEDIVIRILEGLAESSQSKYIFLSELINRKTKNKTSLLYNLFYRIDGENFVTFVKFLWALWKESTFIFPDPATNPIYSNTNGSLFLPYQSEKTIGFYFTSLKVKENTNTALAVTYETGEYETYTGKDPGGAMTTKSRKVTETASYHPYYPVYLVKTDEQDFVFDDLKHETLVPAFVLYANELKTFWSNVVTTGEYTVDILTTLSGVGNIAKFRHLTKLNKLAQVAQGVKGVEKVVQTSNILRYIKGAAGVVELTSGSLNLLLKITDVRNESPYKELSHFLFYLELLTLAGELTASLKVGLKKSAREAIEKSNPSIRKANRELFDELYLITGIDELGRKIVKVGNIEDLGKQDNRLILKLLDNEENEIGNLIRTIGDKGRKLNFTLKLGGKTHPISSSTELLNLQMAKAYDLPVSSGENIMYADLNIPTQITDEFSGLGNIMLDDTLAFYLKNPKFGTVDGSFGVWVNNPSYYNQYGGQSINLKQFWEAMANNGKNVEKSAFETFTGKWAKENGFVQQIFQSKHIKEDKVIIKFLKD